MKPKFKAGQNIAIKVPPYQFERTVSFYRDILGFEQMDLSGSREYESVVFKFEGNNLWIDKSPTVSQAEIWLEIRTSSVAQAARHFEDCKIVRRDEIEHLPDDLKAFWITSPSDIIHLINE
jgi:hypothetical protein